MRVGFLGTGLLGQPMARRLAECGAQVTAWNRTIEKARALADAGVRVAPTPNAVAQASDVLILMLADAPAIQQVLFDTGCDLRGRVVAQMGTIGAEESRTFARAVRRREGEWVEAPVLGSIPQAKTGSLLIMLGGTDDQVRRIGPLLSLLGAVTHVGAVGDAATMKLALNQMIGGLSAAFSSSLGLVRRAGLDVEDFMGLLRKSAFHAKTFDAKLPRMQDRVYQPANFPARHLLKDLDLFASQARTLGLSTASVDGVRAVVKAACARGHADDDYSALAEAVDPPR